MKITIYTVNDCVFSKQEKDYLNSKGIQFEEKNLETNRAWLDEMLAVSNNFAGTPVTKIEKDNGQTTILKGFTESELAKELEQVPATPSMQMGGATTSDMPAPTPTPPQPTEPQMPTPSEPTPPTTPETPQQPETPAEPPVQEPPTSTPTTPSMSATPPEPPVQEPNMPPTPEPAPPAAPTPMPVGDQPTPVQPPAEPTVPASPQGASPALSSILDQLQSKTGSSDQSQQIPTQAFN